MTERGKNLFTALLFAISGALIACSFVERAKADGTSFVHGLVASGISDANVNPVEMGGSDGTLVRKLSTDATGQLKALVQGPAADGAAASNGIVVAGKDNSGNVRTLNATPSGSALGASPNLLPIGGVDVGAAVVRPLPAYQSGGSLTNATYVTMAGLFSNTAKPIGCDTNGNVGVIGAEGNGSALTGLGVRCMGGDGTNAHDLPVMVDAAAAVTQGLQVSGIDASSISHVIRTDAGGRQVLADANKATYASAFSWSPTATTATDIAGITGSGTKTIKVRRITLTLTATTAAQQQVVLIKRSTADGAFNNAGTLVPLDATDAAATASCGNFTANPSTGTSLGNVSFQSYFVPVTSTAAYATPIVWDFTQGGRKPVTLNAAAQGLFINLNSVSITGVAAQATFEWTEE